MLERNVVNVKLIEMRCILHRVLGGTSNIARLAVYLSVVLMLLTLPLSGVHQPTVHMRAPELRRSVQRHIFLEQTKTDAAERISAHYLQPTGLFQADTADSAKPFEKFAPIPQVSLARLLSRLKLGESRSNTSRSASLTSKSAVDAQATLEIHPPCNEVRDESRLA